MNIKKITSACALTIAVSALPAMAFNTQSTGYRQNRQNGQYRGQDGRFKGMDRNGDGVITRDEWRGNDNSFRKHDRNGDGVISAADRQNENENGEQHRHGKGKKHGDWNDERDDD